MCLSAAGAQKDGELMQYRYNRVDPPQSRALPVAGAGYTWILASSFVTLVFALLELSIPAIAALAATFCIGSFFRDPERFVPDAENAVVSPADGRVVKAEVLEENPFISGPCLKIGIFMSIFNVHVNRVPCSGKVFSMHYQPGRFISASRDGASTENEQQAVILETEEAVRLCFVQVAGLVARRIICWLEPGDRVSRGERFGMICFGSRLDLYLPAQTALNVSEGDRVKAGQSILGFLQ